VSERDLLVHIIWRAFDDLTLPRTSIERRRAEAQKIADSALRWIRGASFCFGVEDERMQFHVLCSALGLPCADLRAAAEAIYRGEHDEYVNSLTRVVWSSDGAHWPAERRGGSMDAESALLLLPRAARIQARGGGA